MNLFERVLLTVCRAPLYVLYCYSYLYSLFARPRVYIACQDVMASVYFSS